MHAQFAQPPDGPALAALVAAQHGVVSVAQLRAAGVARGAVAHRVRVGRLHPVHRGVYAVGRPDLPREGHLMAAVLACGAGAVLSHRARTAIDVSVPVRSGLATRAGLTVHRSGRLTRTDATRLAGIPTTTVARTLLDLAEVVPPRALRRALEQAEALRLLDVRAIFAVLAGNPGRAGHGALARALRDHHPEPALTRSELERRLLELCAAAGLPRPAVNARLLGLEVDFLWPAHRLVVETDGFRHHGTRAAFERDRARDARLTAHGYRTVRLTHRQLTRHPARVAALLRTLLPEPDG